MSVDMELPDDIKAFLLASERAADGGNDDFSTVHVRRSLGMSEAEENHTCQLLAEHEPKLLVDTTYPLARLTTAGRERAAELSAGDPPLSGCQVWFLLQAYELGPRGQPLDYCAVYAGLRKVRGTIYAEPGSDEVARAMAHLLAGDPYRYLDHGLAPGSGSLSPRGRERARRLSERADAVVQGKVSRVHQADMANHAQLGVVSPMERTAEQPGDPTNAPPPPSAIRTPPVITESAATTRPPNAFRKKGKGWIARFAGGDDVVLHDGPGAEYLHALLSDPGKPQSAVDLKRLRAKVTVRPVLGNAGERIDRDALRDYSVRLAAIEVELEEARDAHDEASQDRLEEEKEFLLNEVKGTGLHGSHKPEADDRQRVRKSFLAAITRVISEIRKSDAVFADHLDSSVSCGHSPIYDPRGPVEWDL